MNSYEAIAEVYFLLDNYVDAINYLKKAKRMAKSLNNSHYIEHINSIIAWSHYRLHEYDKSLSSLSLNTGIVDHRMLIPDALLESLIYFSLNDSVKLKESILKIKNPQTLEQMSEELADIFYKLFNFSLENNNYIKSHIWEGLLIYIIDSVAKFVELKKVFVNMLKEYYIQNRRYKDAISIR